MNVICSKTTIHLIPPIGDIRMVSPGKPKSLPTAKVARGALRVIQGNLEDLRNSERKVAQWVLENPTQVIYQSISNLAENAGTSEPTVIRFCRALGFKGYQDLKIQLAQDLVPGVKNIHEDVDPLDDTPTLIRKVFQANMAALSNTRDILDPAMVDKAIRVLSKAKRIEFFGLAGPGVVAMDAFVKFFRLGIPCAFHNDPHLQSMSASLMKPGSVLVVTSHSGATKDVIEGLKVAKEAGAATIAIVSYRKSPAAAVADITLCVHSRETSFKPEPMSSQIAQLSVIDVLAVGVALQHQEEFVANLQKARKAMAGKYL